MLRLRHLVNGRNKTKPKSYCHMLFAELLWNLIQMIDFTPKADFSPVFVQNRTQNLNQNLSVRLDMQCIAVAQSLWNGWRWRERVVQSGRRRWWSKKSLSVDIWWTGGWAGTLERLKFCGKGEIFTCAMSLQVECFGRECVAQPSVVTGLKYSTLTI